MISLISLLTAIGFAAIYPLTFWIHQRDPLKQDFHKFHIGLPNFVGGVAVVMMIVTRRYWEILPLAVAWKIALLSVSSYSWRKGTVKPALVSLPCAMGVLVYAAALDLYVIAPNPFIQGFPTLLFASLLGCVIFSLSLYAMNLGHWYLNVHGLPIKHLMRAARVFWAFLLVRLFWDALVLGQGRVFFDGENIPLWKFSLTLDGIFIWLAVFFGTVFPAVSLYFVEGTLQVKSTQSATGILYVILTSVLIGDLAYKYYMIRYGIYL